MIGDPQKLETLSLAGATQAQKVVIIKMDNNSELNDSEFIDSSALITSHVLHGLFHRSGIKTQIIVDLECSSNIKFLKPTSKKVLSRAKRSMLSKKRADVELQAIHQDPHYSPCFSAGGVLCSRMLESVLYQQHFQPNINDIIRAFCGIADKQDQNNEVLNGLKSSRIYMVSTPQPFIGQSFENLYHYLCRHVGVIPIGILRDNESYGLGNILPFVMTNPMPSLLLRSGDLIYVLAKSGQMG
jgi:hypothetical protein